MLEEYQSLRSKTPSTQQHIDSEERIMMNELQNLRGLMADVSR